MHPSRLRKVRRVLRVMTGGVAITDLRAREEIGIVGRAGEHYPALRRAEARPRAGAPDHRRVGGVDHPMEISPSEREGEARRAAALEHARSAEEAVVLSSERGESAG